MLIFSATAEFARQEFVYRPKTNTEQTTMTQTMNNTQTTNIDQNGGGSASAILLQSVRDVTSCSRNFGSSKLRRQRKPWPDVCRSIRGQTAGGAVASFSQTFPAGTRTAGLIVLKPASWRHESNASTYTTLDTKESGFLLHKITI